MGHKTTSDDHQQLHCFHQDIFWVANAVEGLLQAGLTNVRFFYVLVSPIHVLFKEPKHDPMKSAFNPLLYLLHCDIHSFHCHTANPKDDKASSLN